MRVKGGNCFFVLLIAAFFCGCVSLETYIDGDMEGYTVFPVTSKQKWFSPLRYYLDTYSLEYRGHAEYEGESGIIGTGRYVFFENEREICALEIIETKDNAFLLFAPKVKIFASYKKYIKFLYKDGVNREYTVNTENDFYPEEKYTLFREEGGLTVRVNNYYRGVSKDRSNYFGEYRMGFDFIVNDERYGILAFSPRAFYLKTQGKIERNMALFILAAMVSVER